MLGLHDIHIRVAGSLEDEDDTLAEETVDADEVEFDPAQTIEPEDHPTGFSLSDLIEECEEENEVSLNLDIHDDDAGGKVIHIDIAEHGFEQLSELEECCEALACRIRDWVIGE